MLAKVSSCALIGLEGTIVEVETDISAGLPSFTIVGLPDAAVQEARERVRAAIRNSGFTFPVKRIVANLAPADFKKAGPAYDLSIALAILISSEQLKADISQIVFLGELSLDGSLRHTSGILPMVALAYQNGYRDIIVPACDAREASLVEGTNILPFNALKEITEYLQGDRPAPKICEIKEDFKNVTQTNYVDLSHIKGQENVKRALEVAAAGGHNMVMTGPPGSGKTMLARALVSILPPMTSAEALEVTKIYSIAGLLPPNTPLINNRPLRSPHYTISSAGLVGGGTFPKPGEISLSHRGVLFLDELPEFGHSLLELLRQPLEDKTVTISRAQGSVSFPANFMLVGAMNPCPCGFFGDNYKHCTCPPGLVTRYQRRISGPFLDRVDIVIDVPRIEYEKLSSDRLGESSEAVSRRVGKCRDIQLRRFATSKILSNAEMTPAEIRQFCMLEDASQNLLRTATKQLFLSARAYHRILKLARTIADLENNDIIKSHHLAEAIQYRPRWQV
ncbi:YifB family Mg chelatase-like AAA ATPase [Dehalococcoides mccartyi]|uniref:Magnesium chelatase n=1 Tax=Dehalococcoides mccartyi (strain VS) TaxID=311424 RepID=D2BI35_DEHMV|nr:YifB family Mg chelatase-like AAA ATPase [Dehalococcoides mccartyi]ACZ61985.1 magnesium chelatase [Dehalococcoides mccartyi VS]